MSTNPLFLIAALFNWAMGGLLFFAYPFMSRLLGFEGPADVMFHIVAGIVLLFGFAYWLVWRDAVRFRPYISLGAFGKLVFVVAIYAHWAIGTASGMLALLVSADLVFAFLFFAYLRRTSLNSFS